MGLPRKVWHETLKALEKTIPKYDLGNKILSLLQDWRIRKHALSEILSEKNRNRIIDIGGGPGTLEQILSKYYRHVIYVDFSKIMISHTKEKFGNKSNIDYIRATFEYLPFKEKSIDVAIASYALRDSFNLPRALFEIAKAIRGKIVIADIGKPDRKLLSRIMYIYLKNIVPITTSIITGWIRNNPWKLIHKTFTHLPTNTQYKRVVEKIFGAVEIHKFILGAAVIIIGEAKHPSNQMNGED